MYNNFNKKFIPKKIAIYLTFYLIVSLFISFFAYIRYTDRTNLIEDLTFQKTESDLKKTSFLIDEYLNGLSGRVVDFSSDGLIRDELNSKIVDSNYSPQTLNTHLIDNKKSLDERIQDILVLDSDGIVFAGTNPDFIDQNFGTNISFINTYTLQYGFANTFYSDDFPQIDQDLIIAAAPLTTTDEQNNIGVIINLYSKKEIFNTLEETLSDGLLEFKVFTPNNELIYPSLSEIEQRNEENIFQTNSCEFSSSRETITNNSEQILHYCSEYNWVVSSTIPNNVSEIVGVSYENYIILTFLVSIIFSSMLFWLTNVFIFSKLKSLFNNKSFDKNTFTFPIIQKTITNFLRYREENETITQDLQSQVEKRTNELKEIIKKEEVKNKKLSRTQTALFNVIEDVEQEKEKSQQLSEDLIKFQLAAENSNDIILISDSDFRILYANPAVQRVLNIAPSKVIGRRFRNLWHKNQEQFITTLESIIKSKFKEQIFESEVYKEKGIKLILNTLIKPVLDENQDLLFFLIIERDVTRAKEIDKMKTEFISLASHQLRTPLSSMRWYLELLSDSSENMSNEQNEMVHQIEESNKRMIDLVNSLLNVSRIESGRIIIDPKPTDMKELINTCIEDVKDSYRKKEQSIEFKSEAKTTKISVDSSLIRQVILNILTNASKYTGDKGEIKILVTENKKYLIIKIKDNGIGMSEEVLNRIFTKFYRAEDALKSNAEGNGLGLYLTKSIIESSQGKIEVKSEKNKGSEFIVYLPKKGTVPRNGRVKLN